MGQPGCGRGPWSPKVKKYISLVLNERFVLLSSLLGLLFEIQENILFKKLITLPPPGGSAGCSIVPHTHPLSGRRN